MSAKDQNLTLCFNRATSEPAIVRSSKPTYIPENHILIKVDRFAFSANNLTYQTLADHPHFRYYDFHPAPKEGDVSPQTHGVVPVWGFGTVVATAHPKVRLGERLYGYFAPTRFLLLPISKTHVSKFTLQVPRPYLPTGARLYNEIIRCNADPLYSPQTENLMMLYRPLFWSSYWCEDWLFCSEYRGGCSGILVSSASSKTAFCFAYCVRKTDSDIKLIGLTSRKNKAFTERLGLYDEVYDYDSFTAAQTLHAEPGSRWMYVDVAGNSKVTEKVHHHFSAPHTPTLVASISLGMSSRSPANAGGSKRPWTNVAPSMSSRVMGQDSSFQCESNARLWPKPEQFYTPEWVEVRMEQLPTDELVDMQKTDWAELMKDCKDWVKMEQVYGGEEVKKAYQNILKGGLGPEKGLIWSLWEDETQTADSVAYQAKL